MLLNGDDVVFLAASNNLLKFISGTSIGSVSRVVSVRARTFYMATLRAWSIFGALRPGAGSKTWLQTAPL